MTTANPTNYKTQDGLLKAISRWSNAGIFTKWLWLNTKTTLIDRWGWDEKDASRYCDRYHSPEEILTEGFSV